MGANEYTECIETIRLDLLELFGNDYVFDHCVIAIRQKAEKKQERYYIADALYNINAILAHRYSGNYMSARLSEIMEVPKEPDKSGDEIAADIIRRAELKTEGGSAEHGL